MEQPPPVAAAETKSGTHYLRNLSPAARLLVQFSKFSEVRKNCSFRRDDQCTCPKMASAECRFGRCPKLHGGVTSE